MEKRFKSLVLQALATCLAPAVVITGAIERIGGLVAWMRFYRFHWLLFVIVLGAGTPVTAVAQCTYTATRSGNFSDPTLFQVTGPATCETIPRSGADDVTIIINGFNVKLDRDYAMGRRGSLTVSNGGTLTGDFTLTLGDGTSAQNDTYLRIQSGSTVNVEQLKVNKATITVAGPIGAFPRATLATDCNLLLFNSEIVVDGLAYIHGNLDVTALGANNSLCSNGTGQVVIAGCVYGTPGHKRQVTQGCSRLSVCVRQVPQTSCPGPISAQSPEERECDLLGSNTATACAPLPVELAWFTALPDARRGSVALRWATAAERNCKSFTVERSADGQVFRDLRTLAGAGASTRFIAYEATDEMPLPNASYYRLRQTDFDGTSSYSPVRAVHSGHDAVPSLEVYPGPRAYEWLVISKLHNEVAGQVTVLDMLGRSQPASCTPDPNQPGRWAVDLHLLPTGVYLVRLRNSRGVHSQRIVRP